MDVRQDRSNDMKTNTAFRVAGIGALAATAVAAGCAILDIGTTKESRAIPEAQGLIVEKDGKRAQVRYNEAPYRDVQQNWEQWPTLAYNDKRTLPEPQRVSMPKDLKGEPKEGRKLFMARAKGPCTGCHLIQGDDVWPAGNIGPDLSTIGDRQLGNDYLYQYIHDPRVFNPHTVMPPWGAVGGFTPQEIVHMVAFLQSQKGPLSPEKDPARNPFTRPKPVYYFGDNLDPVNNPAVIAAEGAIDLWNKKGPNGQSCAGCHGGIESMKGVATKYPRHYPKYKRVMSIEEVIAWHGIDETGLEHLRSQGADNLNLTVLIKMQSNGMPVNVDITSPEAKAAYERGRANYYRKVGQRNHACADCHDPARGGGKFLGGRLLGIDKEGMTKHFPTYRTNFGLVWDMRRRMQWCMLPLGMNMLPGDAMEYAELELYITAFDNGNKLTVPGMRH
jgi:sulfur-oxidizing protein SoxA